MRCCIGRCVCDPKANLVAFIYLSCLDHWRSQLTKADRACLFQTLQTNTEVIRAFWRLPLPPNAYSVLLQTPENSPSSYKQSPGIGWNTAKSLRCRNWRIVGNCIHYHTPENSFSHVCFLRGGPAPEVKTSQYYPCLEFMCVCFHLQFAICHLVTINLQVTYEDVEWLSESDIEVVYLVN